LLPKALGWTVSLVLPAAAAGWASARLPALPLAARFVALFLAPLTAGYLGVLLREPVLAVGWWARDLLLATVMALAAWAFQAFLLREGGGAIDPALLAVLSAYLLVFWPVMRT
jgi:hypothetical protein